MRELPIEPNVPLPTRKRQPRTVAGRTGVKMRVGDSVFTASHSEMEGLRSTIYSLGGKCATRKGLENGVLGWRVWRTA